MNFSNEFIDRVRVANPIVEVIGERITLTKFGKNHKACCPFHNEKTPSFTVASDKGIFKCFGCGEGGNVFNFIMKFEGTNFSEAIELLAKRAGIPLELPAGVTNSHLTKLREKNSRLLEVCWAAGAFFSEKLLGTKDVMEYLNKRAINLETARAFKLGYAPSSWDDLYSQLRKNGFSLEEIEAAGLISKTESGTITDKFRNRLIFPIWNLSGDVIAFAGRAIDDALPKYLNSPETPLYNKSKVLYPINLTKKAIAETKTVIICEGYMDVIALAKHGFINCIASCGTALTQEHAHLLKRFAKKVIVAYDGDQAGQAATVKNINVLLEQGLEVRVLSIPAPDDPDSYLTQNGTAAFQELLDHSQPFFEFLLESLIKTHDISLTTGKLEVFRALFPIFEITNNEIFIEDYIQKISNRIGTSINLIQREYAQYLNSKQKQFRVRKNVQNDFSEINKAEKILLAAVLSSLTGLEYVYKNFDSKYIQNTLVQEIMLDIFKKYEEDNWNCAELYINEISETEHHLITTVQAEIIIDESKIIQIIEDCCKTLINDLHVSQIAKLKTELLNESDSKIQNEILIKIQNLQKKKNENSKIKKLTLNN